MTEPWLTGPIDGVDALLAPVLYSFEQTRIELAQHVGPLTAEQAWSRPHGVTPVGFHVRHIGGAADRLSTYLRGGQLSEAQMARLRSESEPGASGAELLVELAADLDRVESVVRSIDPATLRAPRGVGRKMLPTTVQGLLVHIAEHTQRHLGQAITTAKLLRPLAP
jgi:uncharacterized damage-inducible protein DinB